MGIVHELRRARGGNKKLAILHQYTGNEDWKRILLAMYDTSINYYVSAPKDNTFIEDPVDVDDMMYGLSELADRTYTGNAARAVAREYSEKYGEIFRLILDGSLKAGISVTTINKAYPDLIPTFPVMLAKDVEVDRYPILASTKFDGVRVIAFVNNGGKVQLKTRAGKLMRIRSLEMDMALRPPGVYDGELVMGDGKQVGRTKITGYVNKVLKGTAIDIPGYTFCIFDFVPIEAWDRRQCTWGYYQRLAFLEKNVSTSKHVVIAEQLKMHNLNDVNELFSDRLIKGYEGLILRSYEDPYIWGRSAKLIKKKAIKEGTLGCYDTTEGTGKYEGMIGALMCAGTVDGKQVRVKIGSGLSDHDREGLHAYYIGKDIEILYNDIVRAEGASHYSLFLPRFKRVLGDINV